MMKKLIVYKSIFGTTAEYAKWLGEEIGCGLEKYSVNDAKLKESDLVVVMSGTYAGFMPLIGFLKKKWEIIRDKNVYVICVGMTPQDDEQSRQSFNKIPDEIKKKIKYFKIPGKMGQDISKFKRENLEKIVSSIKRLK